MPSGGQKALDEDVFEFVWTCCEAAKKHGLQAEWLRWFAGGLAEDGRLTNAEVIDHANRACLEWDF